MVIASPYRSPVYEYAIAIIIGAYIPYDLLPNIYLAKLTMVATIATAISNSSVCSDIPLLKIQVVKGEYSIYTLLIIYWLFMSRLVKLYVFLWNFAIFGVHYNIS